MQASSDLKNMGLSLRGTEAKLIHPAFEKYLFKIGIELSAVDVLGLHCGQCRESSDLSVLCHGEPQ